MAHSAAEGTLRRGGTGEDAGQGEEDGAVPNFPVQRGDGGEETAVKDGAKVSEGDLIVVLEAMKMEQPLTAHKSGKVTGLKAKPGDTVTAGSVIATIK